MNENRKVPKRTWLVALYLWACERLYHEFAGQYDAVSWLVSIGQWRKWQATIWPHIKGVRILEVGCGTGAMQLQGGDFGLCMVGLDRSPEMLAVAAKRMAGQNERSQLMLGDGHNLPVESGSFDSVVATFPAGYILDPSTLSEIRRVLRSDGRVVIAGLWVAAHLAFVESLPIFYGRPSEEVIGAMSSRVMQAGFSVLFLEESVGPYSVGVLVAEKVDPV